jgi:hypothetical protein
MSSLIPHPASLRIRRSINFKNRPKNCLSNIMPGKKPRSIDSLPSTSAPPIHRQLLLMLNSFSPENTGLKVGPDSGTKSALCGRRRPFF